MAIKGLSNAGQVDVLEYWFRGTAKTAATHLGLLTTMPTAGAGTGAVEVSGGGYSRQAFAQNTTNWGSASGGDPSTIQNAASVTWPTATAAWATGTDAILGIGYYDASTAGNLLAWFTLTASKTIDTDDVFKVATGGLTFKLGDSDDSY